MTARLFHFPKPESSDFRLDSEFVYKTVPLGITPSGACVVQTHLARNPLRLIIARTPIAKDLPGEESTTAYFIDTLECGHQRDAFFDFHWDEKGHMVNVVPKAKRHRCITCGENQLALKFKPQPVSSPRKEGVA